jgi:hypothetical protein
VAARHRDKLVDYVDVGGTGDHCNARFSLAFRAAQNVTDLAVSPVRDLVAQGIGNFAAGFAGGIAGAVCTRPWRPTAPAAERDWCRCHAGYCSP